MIRLQIALVLFVCAAVSVAIVAGLWLAWGPWAAWSLVAATGTFWLGFRIGLADGRAEVLRAIAAARDDVVRRRARGPCTCGELHLGARDSRGGAQTQRKKP